MTPAELRKLIEAATPGLWPVVIEGRHQVFDLRNPLQPDEELIVALQNLAPLLLAAWEAMEVMPNENGCRWCGGFEDCEDDCEYAAYLAEVEKLSPGGGR